MKIRFVLIFFLLISLASVSTILLDERLIGRFLDFSVPPEPFFMKNAFNFSLYTWWDGINAGIRNSFGTTLVPVNIVLYAPTFFGINSPWFIARYQIVTSLFLGLTFFYLFATKILTLYIPKLTPKIRSAIGILTSIFFVFNNYLFTEIIFGSNVMYMTLMFMPFFLYGFFVLVSSQNKAGLYIMLLAVIIIGSTMQHLVVAYILLLLLCLIYKKVKLFITISTIHVLVSLYWILPLAASLSQIEKAELALNYTTGLITSSPTFIAALINMDYFGNRDMYRLALGDNLLSGVWTLNAFVLLMIIMSSGYVQRYLSSHVRKLIMIFLLLFLSSILFLKGAREPFGGTILALYKKIALLNLFRSVQRFLSFYIVSASTLLVFSAAYLTLKNKKWLFVIFLLVIINAMPWWKTRDMGMANIAKNELPGFNLFYLTEGNHQLYKLNNEPLEFALLTIPPGQSINFKSTPWNKMPSQGSETGLLYNNKRTYETEASMGEMQPVMEQLEKDIYVNPRFFNQYQVLLKLLNIKYIVIREDAAPNFSSNRFLFNTRSIRSSLKKSSTVSEKFVSDDITIVENNAFLPQIYTADTIHITQQPLKEFVRKSMEFADADRPAFLFNQQNKNLNTHFPLNGQIQFTQGYTDLPVIEYRKVNPTQYQIYVHRARDSFLLVMSNSFHPWWNIYLDSIMTPKSFSKEGFISENLSGSIQNNTLAARSILGHLLTQPYDTRSHFVVNGFANAWMLKTDSVCRKITCVVNKDGTYDFTLSIEFLPQKLYSLGAIISFIILSGILLHALFFKIIKDTYAHR